jgi:hypothetical protein
MGLDIEEQELHINANRTDNYAEAYASDLTWQTKLNKLVEKIQKNFLLFQLLNGGRTYKFPKKYISIRCSSKTMTNEQKEAASKRFKKLYAEGKIGRKAVKVEK